MDGGLPESVVGDDHLPAHESERLEIRSIARGWLMEEAAPTSPMDQVRQAMMRRMASICTKAPDERTAVAAFRALTQAEQREQALRISAMRATQMPVQVNVDASGSGAHGVSPEAPAMFEVIQELLMQQEVIEVVSGGHVRDSRDESEDSGD